MAFYEISTTRKGIIRNRVGSKVRGAKHPQLRRRLKRVGHRDKTNGQPMVFVLECWKRLLRYRSLTPKFEVKMIGSPVGENCTLGLIRGGWTAVYGQP